MEMKSLTIDDLEAVAELAKELSAKESEGVDPMVVEMVSWSAPWRVESLEHYLPIGWCLGAYEEEKIVGYLLCQPILFFSALTQCLWVEDVAGERNQIRSQLVEASYKWAKSKHLQRVYFNDNINPDYFGLDSEAVTLKYVNSAKMG